MRKLYSILLLLLAAGDSLAAAPPAGSFDSFFAHFRAAIVRNEAKAVADLTKFLFLFDGKSLDHGSFQKVYPQLLDAKVRACFMSAKAISESDRYGANCGRYIFYFGVVGGRYQVVEFAADPEAAP